MDDYAPTCDALRLGVINVIGDSPHLVIHNRGAITDVPDLYSEIYPRPAADEHLAVRLLSHRFNRIVSHGIESEACVRTSVGIEQATNPPPMISFPFGRTAMDLTPPPRLN